MNAAGRVALVTGGARRVGRIIALTLAGRGSHVAIHYNRSRKEAERTADEIREHGVKAMAVQGEISRTKDVKRIVSRIERGLGPIEILINNASVFERTPWPRISDAVWDLHMNVNLKGPFLCAREVGPKMVRRGRGKIINIVDWAGERPYRDYMPYCASKAGLINLTKALAKTLAPHVQVNGIAPGPVLLPEEMSEAEKQRILKSVPLKRVGSPEDVAQAVLFLVEGTDYATGSIVYVDGGRLIA